MNNHFWISHRYDFPSLFLFSHRRFCTEITRGIIAEVAPPNLQRCEEQPSRRLSSDFASYHAILDPMYQRGRPEGNIVQETKGTSNKVCRGRSGPTGKINVNLSVARAYRRSIPAGISFAPVSFNGNKFKNLKIKRHNRHFNLRSFYFPGHCSIDGKRDVERAWSTAFTGGYLYTKITAVYSTLFHFYKILDKGYFASRIISGRLTIARAQNEKRFAGRCLLKATRTCPFDFIVIASWLHFA